MKRDKLFTALWGAALSFLLSFSAVAGLASAFSMAVPVQTLAWVCLGSAVLSAVCYSLPLGLIPPGCFALALGYFWRNGALEYSVESLLYRLSKQYHQGYGWGILHWTGRVAEQMEQTLPLVLCLLGALIGMLLCRGICRRKSVIPAVLVNVLCLSVCFVVNDTPPDTGYLYGQMLALVVLLLTAGVSGRDAAQGNRLRSIVTPVTALALLVLFASAPRQSYNHQLSQRLSNYLINSSFVQQILGHTAQTGDVGEHNYVDLTQVGYQTEGKSKILEVKADYTATVYLRGRAYCNYDGERWTEGEDSGLSWPEALPRAGIVEISTKYAHNMLYVPYYAASRSMRETAFGVPNGNKLTQYSFATMALPTNVQLSQYQTDSSGMNWYLEQYIHLPDSVRTWTSAYVAKLTSGTGNVYQKAQNIASFVRSSALYDTNTPRMPLRQSDFAQWFLENCDTGYCVHFATAATVLLQAAGIPARYVTGYMVEAKAGEAVEVTTSQAHAWCEYYLPGFGWTILEATPADLRQEATEETTTSTVQTETASTGPTNSQPIQNKTEKPADMHRLWNTIQVVASVLILTGLVRGQYALRRRLLKKRLSRGNTNAQALAWWRYIAALSEQLKTTPEAAVLTLAQKAKFSQHTLTEEELERLMTYADSLVQALKKGSLAKRLYCRLILALY